MRRRVRLIFQRVQCEVLNNGQISNLVWTRVLNACPDWALQLAVERSDTPIWGLTRELRAQYREKLGFDIKCKMMKQS